jgi:hypothetical protein
LVKLFYGTIADEAPEKEDYFMPKLDKRYLTLREFLVLPIEPPLENNSRSNIKGLITEREITLHTQIKGSFQPLADMGKDLVDTFKPYRSNWYAKRDAKQPLYGTYNFFKGIVYIFASLLLLIIFPIYCLSEKTRPKGYGYFSTLGGSYVFALSWFIDGILSIVRGATKIATTPLTWFIKMPLRGIMSVFTDEKDLLIKNKPSIQALVTEAKKVHAGKPFLEGEIKRTELINEIHRKYQKGTDPGWDSGLTLAEERRLYLNIFSMDCNPRDQYISVYLAFF